MLNLFQYATMYFIAFADITKNHFVKTRWFLFLHTSLYQNFNYIEMEFNHQK